MKKYLTIITFFISLNILSQSKKEQIEILTNRVDSLNRVLGSERNSNQNKINELNTTILNLDIKLKDNYIIIDTLNRYLMTEMNLSSNKILDLTKKIKEIESKSKYEIDLFQKKYDELNALLIKSTFKIFCLEKIFEVESWTGHISLIGIYLGDHFELIEIEDDATNLDKSDFIENDIPPASNGAVMIGLTGGTRMYYSIIENGYLKVYSGHMGEEDTRFTYELYKKYYIPTNTGK